MERVISVCSHDGRLIAVTNRGRVVNVKNYNTLVDMIVEFEEDEE